MGWWGRKFPKRKPRREADGIKAKTTAGKKFGQTWWGGRWLGALERLVDPNRLQRGRSYARSGQVLDLEFSKNAVDSRVQGSRRAPYKVHIEIAPLTDAEWDRVSGAMAAQAIFAAKLLAGEMPQNIEEAFSSAGVSLFPARPQDLTTDCSCPDWANPCKHSSAVYYLLSEQFDADPFLLFQLRGRKKEQIISDLRARRGAQETEDSEQAEPEYDTPAAHEEFKPLADCLDNYWEPCEDLSRMEFSIQPPPVEAAPIKLRGEPPFWDDKPDFTSRMSDAYARISGAAIKLVVGD
jgi:uncharacterized Zn finger protein